MIQTGMLPLEFELETGWPKNTLILARALLLHREEQRIPLSLASVRDGGRSRGRNTEEESLLRCRLTKPAYDRLGKESLETVNSSMRFAPIKISNYLAYI